MSASQLNREHPSESTSELGREKIYTTKCNNKIWYLCVNYKEGKPNYHFRASIQNLPKGVKILSSLPDGYRVEGTAVNKINTIDDIFDSWKR